MCNFWGGDWEWEENIFPLIKSRSFAFSSECSSVFTSHPYSSRSYLSVINMGDG